MPQAVGVGEEAMAGGKAMTVAVISSIRPVFCFLLGMMLSFWLSRTVQLAAIQASAVLMEADDEGDWGHGFRIDRRTSTVFVI